MEHFLLTRFNLRLWTRDKNNCPTLTEDWLEKRFILFERYCLPSVLKQSCQNFTWILLIDSETPSCYKDRLDRDVAELKNVRIIKVIPQYSWGFAQIFGQVVNKYRNGDSEKVLTTYLDSDDALGVDYVKWIHEEAASITRDSFITFCYGIQYFTEYDAAIRVKFSNNHFVTLVELMKEGVLPHTVYGYGSHADIFRHQGLDVRTIRDKGKLGWMEVVHALNVVNDFKMRLDVRRVKTPTILSAFGIDKVIDTRRSIFFFHLLPHAFSVFLLRIKQRMK